MKRPLLALLSLLLLGAFAVATPDRLSEARKLADRELYREAEAALQDLVEKDGENADAYALLAEVRLKLGDVDGAHHAADLATEIDKGRMDLWMLYARTWFEKGRRALSSGAPGTLAQAHFADAQRWFTHVLKMETEKKREPNVRWWLGWTNEYLDYRKGAAGWYDKQIALFPKVPEGWVRKGLLIFREAAGTDDGKTPRARARYRDALKVFSDGLAAAGPHALLLYEKGRTFERLAEWDNALECFLEAVRVDPDLLQVWQSIRAYAKVNRCSLAKVAEEVYAAHPDSPGAAGWYAFTRIQAGEPREALKAVLPLLEKKPGNYTLFLQAYTAASKLRRTAPREWLDLLEHLHETYPYSGGPANDLGLYYRDSGRPKESLKWYLRAMEREPDNQDILNDTALIYLFHFQGKMQKKSLPIFEKVLSLVQDDGQQPMRGYWDTLENLCKYYWEVERDPEKVIRYAELRSRPRDGVPPYSVSRKAELYRKLAEDALKKK